MNPLIVIPTEDGSSTCLHHQHQASYRSTSGAVREVRHVFIDSTIHLLPSPVLLRHGQFRTSSVAPQLFPTKPPEEKNTVRILEFGFGLGTSFAETLAFTQTAGLQLEYVSIEREPVNPDDAQHPDDERRRIAAQLLEQLQTQICASCVGLDYRVTVVKGDFLSYTDDFSADAIYFDPFGPKVNPESWTPEVFAFAATKIAPWGRLATYSAAGHVRRALASAGWLLARRPGPGRKREITVAARSYDALPTRYKTIDASDRNGDAQELTTDLEWLSMDRYLRQ